MQSPVKDVRMPDFERPKLELPEFEMPKIDLSNVEIPKVDVGKAIADAATAVGLTRPRRSRWPFVIGAGIVVAVAGWTAMNSAAVRDRLSQAKSWISERVADMRSGEYEEPVAFTAAETKPIEDSIDTVVSDPMSPDYPDGFGASKESLGTESLATNGRSTTASTSR